MAKRFRIKCPNCGKVFSVDDSGYAAILRQVHDREFEKELSRREEEFRSEKESAVELAVTKAEARKDRRIAELMSELETFKTKAAKYDELEEAKKDELQKATERAEKLQAELDSIKKTQSLKEMREKVAKDAGIPINSMSLITGETEEACKEQADLIKAMMVPGHYPSVPDGGEVTNLNNGSARDVFKDWAQQMND